MRTIKSTFVRTAHEGHSYLVAHPRTKRVHGVMVFIHGAAGFAAYMSDLMQYFVERGYVCYAPDIIGHGERGHLDISEARMVDYIDDMQDFIEGVVLHEWKRKLILVGHSMGGGIAQKLSEHHFVEATILITPTPPKGVSYVIGGIPRASLGDHVRLVTSILTGANYVPSRELIESLFADPEKSAGIIDKWSRNRVANESIKVLMELWLSRIEVDRARIHAPMLVIGAKKDIVIHPRVAEEMAEYYGDVASLVMLEDLGHMCPFEHGWEETALAIDAWLQHIKKK